jgi:hypothetical protein
MKDQEVIDDFDNKLTEYSSRVTSLGSVIEETKLVKKFLNELAKRFINMVASIEQVVDLKTIGYDDGVVGLRLMKKGSRLRRFQPSKINFYLQVRMKRERKKSIGVSIVVVKNRTVTTMGVAEVEVGGPGEVKEMVEYNGTKAT